MNSQKLRSDLYALSVRGSLAAALLLLIVQPLAAQANAIPCTSDGKTAFYRPLQPIPEIVSEDGVLRGELYTVSEQQRMTSGGSSSEPTCFPQWVRAYRREAPASWNPPASQLLEPIPGPTLRARIGDMVELTFLNVIDSNKFPNADKGCDQTSVYPAKGPGGDRYPDCFAGSVFTNMHYHGTHTNPNSTGDNVFLQIRPSPRKTDGSNAPLVDGATVKQSFTTFFNNCEAQLKLNGGPKIWPRTWDDLPQDWVNSQQTLLKQYAPAWAVSNEKLRANGDWPQYYVGAYPYCFKLPAYPASPAGAGAEDIPPSARTPHSHGAGSSEIDEAQAPERPLIMGQSPGTHWYHAHKHGSTTINVLNGMTGVFIIEGPYDDALNAKYGKNWTRTQPTLVINQLGTAPGLLIGRGTGPGPALSVNGRLRPTITMPGKSVQMWRIANTSGRAGVQFLAPSGITWRQLAQDGVQFNDVNYKRSTNVPLLLASGNRADLLVKAPAYNAAAGANNTYDVFVYNTVDPSDIPPMESATKLTLLRVVVTPDGNEMDFIEQAPPFPDFLADIEDKDITGTKVLTFASSQRPGGAFKTPSQHTIDGKKFDGEVGAVVGLNRIEEWKIVNASFAPASRISHPFHIHVNPFQVSEVFDPGAALSTAAGAGRVTTTSGSSTVTGIDTAFHAAFRVGDYIWIAGESAATVVSIASDTELTLNIKAGGVKDATYTAAVPLYTIDGKNARAGQCVLDPARPATWKPCTVTESAENRIWWDVFPIPSGNIFTDAAGAPVEIPGYFKMRSRFVDYAGYFVLHCHILAHEDRGMMTVVEVAPVQTPYSHH